jgi:hypothetical protein
MKRCPTCDRTFDEDWLSFCTNDGTALIEDSPKTDLAATIMAPAPPPISSPGEPANWNSPSGWNPPSGGIGSGQFPAPQPPQPVWQPPPPPSYAAGPQQSFAVASLITGVFTITIGLCCYLGVISGPVAIALGIYSLNQIKNEPDKFTGRPFAIAGIVMGALYFVFVALIIVIYGLTFLVQGIK